MSSVSFRERFLNNVMWTESCWIWMLSENHHGYGQHEGQGAHRTSWELHRGVIPEGMLVLHKCDNRLCVNPAHLYLGTPKDNTQDMIRKGRNSNTVPAIRKANTKLTDTQVAEIRRKYEEGDVPQRSLAKEYNVSVSRISELVRCIDRLPA